MNPLSTLDLMNRYGMWPVLFAFAILAIVVLWRALQRERHKRDADTRGFHLHAIQTVKEMAEREAAFNTTIRMFVGRHAP